MQFNLLFAEMVVAELLRNYVAVPFRIRAPANYLSLFTYNQQISITEIVFANPNVHLS